MKALLTRVLLPVLAVGAVIGAVIGAIKLGWITDGVAFWLWPLLIAVLFLILSILAFLGGARLLLWPLLTGLVVQTTGLLVLLFSPVFESRWTPLWYTLGAVGLVLFVMLIVFVVSTVRARILERKMAEGAGGSQEDLARIRTDMKDALDLLKRAGRGRNAVYELPWFLVMGRPAAGKTVAIKNSDLGLPVKRDWVKGVGGTYTADWFFTNELIFLDTPGKWVTEGATDDGREHWRELMRLLRKYRSRQPLDGLIVVVPADDLLSLEDEELEDQATNIREVVALIHGQLQFRFPVYLLVSKCDLVEGFVDFFRGLPAQRRHEILGWSNEDPNRQDADRLIEQGFRRVRRRLEAYRLEMLSRVAKRTQARRLFFFSEEFRGLERPLTVFADALFQTQRYSESPVFRGFYFTSGTQEGAPLSKAMSELARTLGVPAARAHEAAEEESKRSYFLLDLFRELMVGDEGLVGRTAGHWWRRRRNTFLAAFAPAGIALLFLSLSLIALGMNRSTYGDVRSEAPDIVKEHLTKLQPVDGSLLEDDIEEALDWTEQLREYHVQMAGFRPFRTFGMRRPGELEPGTFDLFRDQFARVVLQPTLAEAERLATEPGSSCIDRIHLLHSVVWLRTGRRAGFEDLAGLDPVWGLDSELTENQAERVRRAFRRQYVYLKRNVPAEESGNLLPSFSVRKVARGIRDDCGQQGATSTLEQYRRWQDECGQAPTPADVEACFTELNKVLRNPQKDYEKLRRDFDQLKSDLTDLKAEVPEAKIGLELLGDIDLAEAQTGECLTRFDRTMVPRIEEYAVQEELLQQCRDAVAQVSDRGKRYTTREAVLKEQKALLEEEEERLVGLMADYNTRCTEAIPGFYRLEMNVLKKISESYRRVACLPTPRPTRPTAGRVTPETVTTKTRSVRKRIERPRTYTWFEPPKRVSAVYKISNWEHKQQEWSAHWAAIQGAGYAEEQTRYEQGQVRGSIESYARDYTRQWIRYLQSLRLQAPTPPISSWLGTLSKTPEYEKLIGPAQDAAGLAEQAGDPPFDAVRQRLRPLEGLAELDLGEYLTLLGDVGADLERCERDGSLWQQYRTALAADDRDNSLVKARAWVSRNAGPTLAEGSLTDLLNKPLDEARGYLLSDNLLKRQWEDLRQLYQDEIQGRAPFSADLEGSESVSLKNLIALLGGETGAVTRVRTAAAGETLTAEAEAWLEDAEIFSALLFEPESDDPRAVKLLVAIEEETYDPPEFGKNYRLDEVKVHFGDFSTFDWKPEDDRTKPMKLMLFGDEASEYSYLQGGIAERKGMLKRMIPGKKWKPGEELTAMSASGAEASAEGALAPVRVIAVGLSGGERPVLQYVLEVPDWKKNRSGRVQLGIRLSGKEVGPLMRLITRGLPPPPPSIKGS